MDPDLALSHDRHTALSRDDGQKGALTSSASLEGEPFRADVLAGRSNPDRVPAT